MTHGIQRNRSLVWLLSASAALTFAVFVLISTNIVPKPGFAWMFLLGICFVSCIIGALAASHTSHPVRSSDTTTRINEGFMVFTGVAFFIAILAFGASDATAAPRSYTPEFTAKVVYVDDGDTVIAWSQSLGKIKVRLANIDAPETAKNRCKPGQPFAKQSEDLLARLVKGKIVDFKCTGLDRWERHLCDINLGQTTANRELVASGLAWANRQNRSYLKDKMVSDLEDTAKSRKLGIWSVNDSVPPWVWRHTVWVDTCH